MSHFFLVRHGETIWHAENRYAGSTDIDLTLQGEQQPLVLRGWALNAQLMHLYASTMRRAIATATPTVQATGLSLHTDARLRKSASAAAKASHRPS
jgi:probable phosphoglycerate mutase